MDEKRTRDYHSLLPTEKKAFAAFCRDHITHLETVPMEFEIEDGRILDAIGCWNLAEELGLAFLVKDEAELTPDELGRKYADADGGWGEHPEYPAWDWRSEVASESTRRGYWDWVACQIEEAKAEVPA